MKVSLISEASVKVHILPQLIRWEYVKYESNHQWGFLSHLKQKFKLFQTVQFKPKHNLYWFIDTWAVISLLWHSPFMSHGHFLWKMWSNDFAWTADKPTSDCALITRWDSSAALDNDHGSEVVNRLNTHKLDLYFFRGVPFFQGVTWRWFPAVGSCLFFFFRKTSSLYSTYPAANSRQTQLEMSWWIYRSI